MSSDSQIALPPAPSPGNQRQSLLAATIVLEEESLVRFNFLLASLQAQFQPENIVESALVENIAVARWRQMRLWGMEKAGLTYQMQQHDSNFSTSNDGTPVTSLDAPTRAALAFRALGDESQVLNHIGRSEGRFDRQFHTALDRLLRLRKKK